MDSYIANQDELFRPLIVFAVAPDDYGIDMAEAGYWHQKAIGIFDGKLDSEVRIVRAEDWRVWEPFWIGEDCILFLGAQEPWRNGRRPAWLVWQGVKAPVEWLGWWARGDALNGDRLPGMTVTLDDCAVWVCERGTEPDVRAAMLFELEDLATFRPDLVDGKD